MDDKVNLGEKFGRFAETWSPKIIGEVNDNYVKIAKIQGEFIWHVHAVEDEMFLVVKGRMTLKLRNRDIDLAEGDLYIVPAGIEHCPVAEDECHIMMIEPKTTLNTGMVRDARTVDAPEWI